MYSRKRIPPFLKISGVVIALVLLIILLGHLDFPGWILRVLGGIIPEGRQSAYTIEEVEELRERIGSIEGENALLREMVVNLKGECGLDNSEIAGEHEILPANVIYRDHARLFETAIINRGLSDGVETGMPVIDSAGLVGRVVSTSGAISRIELVTGPDCSFGVIDQRSRELGVVRGSDPVRWVRSDGSTADGGQLPPDILELEYLSPSADISIRDTLVTSGLSGITPLGIRVGEVVEIISRSEQGWFDIRVRPFANLEHLSVVGVVLYREEEHSELEELLGEDSSMVGPPVPDISPDN